MTVGLTGFVLFNLNRHTPVPASWAAAGGPRDGWGALINAIIQSLMLPVTAGLFGALITRRQPTQRIGWLLLAVGVVAPLVTALSEWAVYANYTSATLLPGADLAAWVTNWAWVIVLSLILLLVALFPSGAFLSRRWRALILTGNLSFVVIGLVAGSIETPMTSAFQIPNPYVSQFNAGLYNFLFSLMVITLLGTVLIILMQTAVRFRRSGGVERSQLKWLLLGVAGFAVLVAVGLFLFTADLPVLDEQMLNLRKLGAVMVNSAALMPLLGVGIAMVRYQLYDIDVIIRRTTSYAVVTGLLALVYFATIVILQRVFTTLTGQTSTVAVVLSTLLIAALFLPVRRRVQDAIDRRFFRRKYDAEKVLNAFAATVRDETDLDALTAELVRVIRETMQPEFVSVWLKPVHSMREAAERSGGDVAHG